MIVLDTNVISEVLRDSPDRNVLSWLDLQNPLDLYLTSITMAEMEYGMRTLPDGKRRQKLGHALHAIFEQDFHGRVLSFDMAAARLFGIRMAAARSSGKAVGQSDGMIAAIALAQDRCSVATRDRGPFEAMGVDANDPWQVQQ